MVNASRKEYGASLERILKLRERILKPRSKPPKKQMLASRGLILKSRAMAEPHGLDKIDFSILIKLFKNFQKIIRHIQNQRQS